MRVSGRLTDPDFWFLHFDKCPVVTLDGVELKRVVEADDAAGYVTVYEADAQGQMKLTGTRAVQKTTRGKVVIAGQRSEKVV